jgi:hypothetical protein
MAAPQFCVVCGQCSTRAVWVNQNLYGTTFVACDFHSQNAIRAAVTAVVGAGSTPKPSLYNIPKTHTESHQG